MKTNYVIVHGSFGNPFGNWFPWLKAQINSKGFSCIVPYFLSPEHQNFNNWARLLDYYRDLEQITPSTVFVAHSLGSIFVVKYVLFNQIKIKGLISVSGFNNFISGNDAFDKINTPFFVDDEDLPKVVEYIGMCHAFMGDDDPYLPQEVLMGYARAIDAVPHLIHKGGHLNEESGYTRFPALLDVLPFD